MSSRDSNFARISIRVPPSRSPSRTLIVLTGMSAIGVPSVSVNASVKSNEVGGCTAVTIHTP
jgi:chemotaxis protein histidine kinase CheA